MERTLLDCWLTSGWTRATYGFSPPSVLNSAYYSFSLSLSAFLCLFLEVQLTYNVMINSRVQHSDSVIHIHTSILFSNYFPSILSQNVGCSSLCSTAGPHWPIIPHTSVCICQSPDPIHLSLHLGNSKFIFKVYESVSVLQINSLPTILILRAVSRIQP